MYSWDMGFQGIFQGWWVLAHFTFEFLIAMDTTEVYIQVGWGSCCKFTVVTLETLILQVYSLNVSLYTTWTFPGKFTHFTVIFLFLRHFDNFCSLWHIIDNWRIGFDGWPVTTRPFSLGSWSHSSEVCPILETFPKSATTWKSKLCSNNGILPRRTSTSTGLACAWSPWRRTGWRRRCCGTASGCSPRTRRPGRPLSRQRREKSSSSESDKGHIGYSDNAGKPKKCHCKRWSLVSQMMFIITRSFLGQTNSHCGRIVTLTVVTV